MNAGKGSRFCFAIFKKTITFAFDYSQLIRGFNFLCSVAEFNRSATLFFQKFYNSLTEFTGAVEQLKVNQIITEVAENPLAKYS